VRPSLKLLVSACAVAVCAAAPPLAAVAAAPAPTATLAGSVLPSVAHSRLLGHTSASASVRVEFVLRPSHAGLLAKMAARSSGHTGLSQKVLNRLFRPAPAVRAEVAAYMHARGFRSAGAGVLTQSFTGTAAQAEHAFGVSLQNYRLADGTTYRAPAGAIHVPAALAPRVITVDGLNTLPLEHPAGLHHVTAKLKPNLAPLSGCTGSNNEQTNNSGSLQPADLAAANAYNSQPLLTAGDVGTGESVALVEFSNYATGDQATFQTCYSISVPVTEVPVGAGNTSTGGGDEVALDQEVVASQAPGLDHIWTYVAPGSGTMAGMLDKILATSTANGIHIISDSWGICEAGELKSSEAATNAVLQLIAVKAISFFAASGDSGSSDCDRLGFDGFQVDDPAAQQYATGIGGSHLVPANAAPNKERVWDDKASSSGGGGGVSQTFTMPGYQTGPGVIETGRSSKTKCGGKTHFCREVPDLSFDADPATGYVINCTTGSCFPGWNVFGGTSAAAPLMAAFTADSNQFSLANGGVRMGFANPFLYHEFGNAVARAAMFNDVTLGNNNILHGTTFPAGPNYDLATGMGSVDVTQMATDLSNYTRKAVKIHASAITGSASRNPISAGHPTVLSGTLKDRHTHTFLGLQEIMVEGFLKNGTYKLFRTHTGLHGGWSLTLTTKLVPSKFQWHAVYVGAPGHGPAVSPIRNRGVN
jgi:subtilase family serine protease